MNVFDLRDRLVDDYPDYTRSFIRIRGSRSSSTATWERSARGREWVVLPDSTDELLRLRPVDEPSLRFRHVSVVSFASYPLDPT